uniref:Uncharacterized protein n=1 Tax=Arundo donax TaxID=35708 RepID=A0A0A9GC65_ARUDO
MEQAFHLIMISEIIWRGLPFCFSWCNSYIIVIWGSIYITHLSFHVKKIIWFWCQSLGSLSWWEFSTISAKRSSRIQRWRKVS